MVSPTPASPPPAVWLDWLAIAASALCLVHCLALPLLIAAAPQLAASELTHWILLALAVPTSLWALGRGRVVAGPLPLVIGSAGLGLMALAVVLFEGQPADRWLTIAGVSLVAAAHLYRWRAHHRDHRHRFAGRLICATAARN